jgi:hypothetical protein
MRVYVRHPSEFPVELTRDGNETARERLHDVSAGGLCCRSNEPFEAGETVRVHIPVGGSGFSAEGRVAWCHGDEEYGFRIGIAFTSEVDAFRTRMVEQVCHIERYHRQLVAEGRDTSPEQAAAEWIAKYAERFPGAK